MTEFRDLVTLIHSIKDKGLLEDFLLGITTPAERREFAHRAEIVKRLIAGQAQQKVAKDLGVGIATVSRGSKELAEGRFKVLKQIHNRKSG